MNMGVTKSGGVVYLGPKFVITLIPGIVEVALDPLARWADHPGFALAYNTDAESHLVYPLGRTSVQADMPVAVTYAPGEPGHLAPWAAQPGCAGKIDLGRTGLGFGDQTGLFLYPEPPSPRETADLWVGLLEEQEAVFSTTEHLLGSDAPPQVSAAQLLFEPDTQRLLLFGQEGAAPVRNVVYFLDLASGAWHGPREVGLPSGLSGYTVSHDPLRNRALIFGGGSPLGELLSHEVYALELTTLALKLIPQPDRPADQVARRDHGAYLDPTGRSLYVYGGGSVTAMTDVWRLDLSSHRWTQVKEADPSGPAMGAKPLVWYDRYRRRLWIGEATGQDVETGLDMWVLDLAAPQEPWRSLAVIKEQPHAEEAIPGLYLPGEILAYPVHVAQDVPQPGALFLVRLVADQPGLAPRISEPGGQDVARSDLAALDQPVAFYGAPHTMYMAYVEAGSHYPSGTYIPFTVEASEATLVPEGEVGNLGDIRDLVLEGDVALVAASNGLTAVSIADPTIPVELSRYKGGAGGTGIVRCGAHVCLSRSGKWGLRVVDVADPMDITPVGKASTPGPSTDIAIRGARVYLAQGWLGVSIFDLADPAHPSLVGQVFTGGKAVSVAISRSILAVAHKGGEVDLYDVHAGPPALRGTFVAAGKVRRVDFVGSLVHVVAQGSDLVEVVDVQDPGVPLRLGDHTSLVSPVLWTRLTEDLVVRATNKTLRTYRAVDLP